MSGHAVSDTPLGPLHANLDAIAELERAVDVEFFPGAPRHTPRRRLGEAGR